MRNPRNIVLLVTLLIVVGGVVLLLLLVQHGQPTPLTPGARATGRVQEFDPQRLNVGPETPTTDMIITWSAEMESTDIAATNAAATEPVVTEPAATP